MLVLNLPIPPSVNALWRYGSGKVTRSPKYNQWLAVASKIAFAEMGEWPMIVGAYRLEMILPVNMRPDLDNVIKAVNDLLQYCEIIWDDKTLSELHVIRGDAPSNQCVVTVTEN